MMMMMSTTTSSNMTPPVTAAMKLSSLPPSAKLSIIQEDGQEGASFEFSNDIFIGR